MDASRDGYSDRRMAERLVGMMEYPKAWRWAAPMALARGARKAGAWVGTRGFDWVCPKVPSTAATSAACSALRTEEASVARTVDYLVV